MKKRSISTVLRTTLQEDVSTADATIGIAMARFIADQVNDNTDVLQRVLQFNGPPSSVPVMVAEICRVLSDATRGPGAQLAGTIREAIERHADADDDGD